MFLEKKNVPAKDHIMGELIDLKRRRVELEKRKTLALERIALALEMKKKMRKENLTNIVNVSYPYKVWNLLSCLMSRNRCVPPKSVYWW